MREIKFKFWDKDSKSFKDHEDYSVLSNGAVFDLANVAVNENIVPVVYTGLKDKNGTEVYAGDILYLEECRTYSKVSWNDYGFKPWTRAAEQKTLFLLNPEQIEVIGNIYENPELLDETN